MQTHSRTAWAVASLAAAAAIFTPALAQTGPASAAGAPAGLTPAEPPPMDLSKVTPEQSKAYLQVLGWILAEKNDLSILALTPAEIDQVSAGMKLAMTGSVADGPPGGTTVASTAGQYFNARAELAQKAEMAKQQAAADKFFADLEKNPAVKKTASGLYYEILAPGTDPKPTKDDTVEVKYKGTFTDGKVFDSTDDKGPEPTRKFGVGEVIPGWTEGLQLIGKGGKIKLYVPAKLAYGDRGSPPVIPPAATLVFETEIVGIEKTPAQPAMDSSSLQLTPEMLKQLSQPATGK